MLEMKMILLGTKTGIEKHINTFRKSITTGKYDLAVDAYKIRKNFTPNNFF